MTQEITIIPRSLRSYSATWAGRPLTDLMTGDLFYCTDRKVFYRWDGSDWQAQSYYTSSGLYADIPDASELPDGSQYYATDNYNNYMVSGGSWLMTSSLAAKFCDTTVRAAAQLPSTWTDLDISATVGAKKTLAVLQVINSNGSTYEIMSFRPNGCAYDMANTDYFAQAGGVALSAVASIAGIAVCITDDNGVLEIMSRRAMATCIIKLLAYIN